MTLYFNEKDMPSVKPITFDDKETIVQFLIQNFLNKTQSMFEWKGLPKTIPQRALEMSLQRCGCVNIFEFDGYLYQSPGNTSGKLNYNYLPAMSIVSNPYIPNFTSKTIKLYYGKDLPDVELGLNYDLTGVLIPNDSLYLGLLPILNFYSSQLADNVISKKCVTVNSRAFQVYVASTQSEKDDFESFISNLESGKVKAIMAKNIMNKAQMLPYAEHNGVRALTDLIEDQQYIKASLFNELGLNANYNMKRESINSNESQLNEDALLPLPDNMLKRRRECCELINELFGVNWSVDFSSAWKSKRAALEEVIDSIDGENNVDTENAVDSIEEVQPAGQGD